jgi:transcriptional regulator with XRE-family HTH domain
VDPLKRKLGARVKELRKARKMTQQELADKIHIAPKHLSRIEVGGNFPSLKTLAKISRHLKVELTDLFEFSHLKEDASDLRRTLDQLLNRASKSEYKLAIQMIQTLLRAKK